MKTKRMLAYIVAICMLIGLMPMSVFAEPEYDSPLDVPVDAGKLIIDMTGGSGTISVSMGGIIVDTVTYTDNAVHDGAVYLDISNASSITLFANPAEGFTLGAFEYAITESVSQVEHGVFSQYERDALLSQEGFINGVDPTRGYHININFVEEGGPEPVGFFLEPENNDEFRFDSFTVTAEKNIFYLVNTDEHQLLSSVSLDEDLSGQYAGLVTVGAVTQNQVYSITVSDDIDRQCRLFFDVAYVEVGDEGHSGVHENIGLDIINSVPWFGYLWPDYDPDNNFEPSVPDISLIQDDFYQNRDIYLFVGETAYFVPFYDNEIIDIENSSLLHSDRINLSVGASGSSGIWTLTLSDWEEPQLVYGNDPGNRYVLNVHPVIPDIAAYNERNADQRSYIREYTITENSNCFYIVNYAEDFTITDVSCDIYPEDNCVISKLDADNYKVELSDFIRSGTDVSFEVTYDYDHGNGDSGSGFYRIDLTIFNNVPRLEMVFAYDDNYEPLTQFPEYENGYWGRRGKISSDEDYLFAIAFNGQAVTDINKLSPGAGLSVEATDVPGIYNIRLECWDDVTLTYSGATKANELRFAANIPVFGAYSKGVFSYENYLGYDLEIKADQEFYFIIHDEYGFDSQDIYVTGSAIEDPLDISFVNTDSEGNNIYKATVNADAFESDTDLNVECRMEDEDPLILNIHIRVLIPRNITLADGVQNGSMEAPESAYKDDEVTITITPDRGYEIDKYPEGNFNVEFAHGAADGGRLIVTTAALVPGCYSDNGDGTFTVIMPDDGLWVIPHFALAKYTVSGTVANATTGSVNVSLVPDEDHDHPFTLTTNEISADGTAAYSFDNVTFGRYTVKVEQGNKSVVESIDVADDTEVPTITLPDLNIKTEVNNTSNLTVSVSGLSESAEDDVESTVDDAVENVDAAESPEDLDIKVTMTISGLSVADENAAKTTIAAVAAEGVTIADVVDITIAVETKVGNTDVTNQLDEDNQSVAETSKVIDIVLTYNVAGKSITVYRIHDGQAVAFTQLASAPAKGSEQDGTFYVDEAAGQIHIYTDKFSVYAIGTENAYAITGTGSNGTVSFTVDGIAATQAASGKTVTIVPSPASGYQFASASAIGASGEELAVSGTTFTMTGEAVTVTVYFSQTQSESGGSGTGGSGAPASDLISPAPATPAAVQFTDVADDAWYKEAVDYVASNDYFRGVTATEFAPEKTMNRAMFATVLYRIAGEPAFSGSSSFSDVESGRYYSTAVAWAEANGFMGGKGSGKFDPNGEITRQEMAVTLYRYAKSNGQGFTGMWMFQLDYTDADQVADWAYEAMCWLTMNKVINGKGGGILDPKGNAKRAEVAQMIMNFDKLSE